MQTVTSIKALREIVQQWRNEGQRIAFVPTMGNLHAGHIKLVTEARANAEADRVIVSIFVNPTQFGVGEDFDTYPRTQIEDEKKLAAANTDLIFLPAVDEIYHQNAKTVVSVSELSKLHCGKNRPQHFDGVATIVTKLFNIVQPDIAVFGEKDFQQLRVIIAIVQDLNIPLEIIAVATTRAPDGLAMSSRNGYLTKQQRVIAPNLYQSLCKARDAVLTKKLSLRAIEQQQQEYLKNLGFKLDYFSICRATDLLQATDKDIDLVILVAAKLGKPRLIDNVHFSK
jgi:pantoate--beta-alanine ligase